MERLHSNSHSTTVYTDFKSPQRVPSSVEDSAGCSNINPVTTQRVSSSQSFVGKTLLPVCLTTSKYELFFHLSSGIKGFSGRHAGAGRVKVCTLITNPFRAGMLQNHATDPVYIFCIYNGKQINKWKTRSQKEEKCNFQVFKSALCFLLWHSFPTLGMCQLELGPVIQALPLVSFILLLRAWANGISDIFLRPAPKIWSDHESVWTV